MSFIRRAIVPALSLTVILAFMQGCSSTGSLHWFNHFSQGKNPPSPHEMNRAEACEQAMTISDYSAHDGKALYPDKSFSENAVPKHIPASGNFTDVVGLDNQEIEEGISNDEETDEEGGTEEITAKSDLHLAIGAKSSEENAAVDRQLLMEEIVNLIGTYYQFGGTNALGGIDCSAFVGTIFSRALGVKLPRTSNAQFLTGKKIKKDKLLIGDLIFFKTRRSKRTPVSHVGIYIGNHLFAHSSRRFGVIVSSIQSKYYSKTYVGARRLLDSKSTVKVSEKSFSRTDYPNPAN